MTKHIEVIDRFLEKFENYEPIEEDDIEELVQNGLIRLMNEHELLVERSVDLIEEILVMFPEQELSKIRDTKFHRLLEDIIKLSTDNPLH